MAPLPTRPGTVLAGVVATWLLLPESGLRTKVSWALLVATLVVLLYALWVHAPRLRWNTPATLLLVSGLCSALSSPRHGTTMDLVEGVAGLLLLVGSALLAAYCSTADVDRLLSVVVVVALIELGVAAACAFLGVPAPFGYLGQHGALFGVNELVPALAGRATGTMGHPIPLGTLMASGAVVALFALRRWPVLLRWLIALACAGGVALSGSRSAALTLVMSVLLAVLWPGVARIGILFRAVVLAAVGVLFAWVDITALPAATSLAGTGSLTHRLGAFDAVSRLISRDTGELLFGSGQGSLASLFADGLLQLDGFYAVDNQWVTTFALGGLVGVVALGAAVAVGLLRGHRRTRPALLVVAGMLLSFDVLEWRAIALLLAVFVALGTSRVSGPVDGTATGRAAKQPTGVVPTERESTAPTSAEEVWWSSVSTRPVPAG
jgi:O-antigen ligase